MGKLTQLTLLQILVGSMAAHRLRREVLATHLPYTAHTAVGFHTLGSTGPTDCSQPRRKQIIVLGNKKETPYLKKEWETRKRKTK